MAELVRAIEAEDLPKVKALLETVFQSGEYSDIQRLGGMTNHSYKVTRADGEIPCPAPGEGTEELINRQDEKKAPSLPVSWALIRSCCISATTERRS